MRRVLSRATIGAALLLGLAASGVMCARVAERGRYATAYSTYSAGPDGARALYELARRAGHPAERWVEDLERLPERGVLVALGGCLAPQRRPLSRYEEESLLAWVRRGGTLMVFGAEDYLPNSYPAHLTRPSGQCVHEPLERVLRAIATSAAPGEERPDPSPSDEDPSAPPGEVSEREASEETSAIRSVAEELAEAEDNAFALGAGDDHVYFARTGEGPLAALEGVPMRAPATVHVQQPLAATILAGFGPRAAALAVQEGEGTLVLFASASMLVNQSLAEHRGGVLFARLLGTYARPSAPVLFDEYHLGAGGARSLVRYLRQIGAGVVLLQLLVLVGLWVTRSGRRLGELDEPAPEPPGGTVSYVAATSALYSRSADRGGIAHVLLRRALERVARHHRLRAREAADVGEQLRAMKRDDAAAACAELVALFSESTASEKDLVSLAHRIDALVVRAMAPRSLDIVRPPAARDSAANPSPEAPSS